MAARYAGPGRVRCASGHECDGTGGFDAGRRVRADAFRSVGATMGSSVTSRREFVGGARCGAAGATGGYGFDGADTGGDAGADVRASAGRDDCGAVNVSTAIRSGCSGVPAI